MTERRGSGDNVKRAGVRFAARAEDYEAVDGHGHQGADGPGRRRLTWPSRRKRKAAQGDPGGILVDLSVGAIGARTLPILAPDSARIAGSVGVQLSQLRSKSPDSAH